MDSDSVDRQNTLVGMRVLMKRREKAGQMTSWRPRSSHSRRRVQIPSKRSAECGSDDCGTRADSVNVKFTSVIARVDRRGRREYVVV